jgi:hypothetical protein
MLLFLSIYYSDEHGKCPILNSALIFASNLYTFEFELTFRGYIDKENYQMDIQIYTCSIKVQNVQLGSICEFIVHTDIWATALLS